VLFDAVINFPVGRSRLAGLRRGQAFRSLGDFAAGAHTMIKSLKMFVANESGATAIEYALIASLVAVAIIASITVLGSKLQNTFNEVSGNLK
jgi:pilus assembly protein Flp/PilA